MYRLVEACYDEVKGQWVPVPCVDENSAELLFRHKVIRLLQGEGLLGEKRTEL